jgi:phosphoribosylformylglycinamidine synthase
LRVLEHGKVVADIPNAALTDDAPLYNRPLKRWEPPVPREKPESIEFGDVADFTPDLKRLLSSPNICGKRWVWQQYDSMVQTNTVEGPGGGDAGVIRIKDSRRGLAMALDGNGRWCYLDPKLGAMHAVAEAARNVACVGATPAAGTNCLNFGNPEKPEIMWQLSQAIDGITKACEELEIPITGGNVSLYNETLGEGIYPTPVLGVVGILEDVETTARMYFREPGCTLILLRGSEPGDATDAEIEFGSSEYAKEILDALWGFPPALELEKEAALIKFLIEAIQARLVDSVHDCSEGGLAVALSESCFHKGVGASVRLASGDLPIECVLFGEDASRVVLSCDPKQVKRIQQLAVQHGISAEVIGETTVKTLEIFVDGKSALSAPVAELRADFEDALENALRSDPAVMAAD